MGHYVRGPLARGRRDASSFDSCPDGPWRVEHRPIKSLIEAGARCSTSASQARSRAAVVAIPALVLRLDARRQCLATRAMGLGADPLLLADLQLANGGDARGSRSSPSPVAYLAEWGSTIALNLMPVGQLDGGHMAYALFGRRRARRNTQSPRLWQCSRSGCWFRLAHVGAADCADRRVFAHACPR